MAALSDCIKGKVHFLYYRANHLWYKCDNDFTFPVPISDIGDATFMAEDKAILFMRYIRRQLEIIADSTGG